MTQLKPIDEFLFYLSQTKGSSKNTIAAYERDLLGFSHFLASSSVEVIDATPEKIAQYKTQLTKKGFSVGSVSRAMSSIRSFYKFLLINGKIEDNPTKSLKNDKAVKKSLEILTSDEIDLLLSQPDTRELKGIRDKAMLETMYATGMKVTELISLDVTDLNLKLGFVICRSETNQKHERTIFLYPAAIKTLKEYLDNSRAFLTNNDDASLFVNINGTRMTRQGFWKILKGYAESAGIHKTITPHTLRHSFATHLLENGADINDIKEILGHSDIASTQIYANLLKNKIKESYLKFHPRA